MLTLVLAAGCDDVSNQPCGSAPDCVSCAARRGCGWCTNSCVDGDESGPSSGNACYPWLERECAQKTTLPVDCRSLANAGDPRCRSPGDISNGAAPNVPPGSIGSGVSFIHGNSSARLGRGFVDSATGRLIVAVGSGGFFDPPGADGLVFAVDLATGDRTVLSANYQDPFLGPTRVGAGPDLGSVRDVKPGPDGWYSISEEGPHMTRGFVERIDPQSGDRTMVYDERTTDCVWQGRTLGIGASRPLALAVGSDGRAYTGAQLLSDGLSVYALVGLAASGCTVVSASSTDPTLQRGAGPLVDAHLGGLAMRTPPTSLLALGGRRLFEIDLVSGDRQLRSSSDPLAPFGSGPQLGDIYSDFSVTLSGDQSSLYNFTGLPTPPVLANLGSGDRTALPVAAGPLFQDRSTAGVEDPTRPGVLLVMMRWAILLYEPKTANSMTFSY